MATTADEHKPDIEHLKSKMIRFPEEILMANLTPLSANQSFRPGMENYEFEIGKTCLEDRVNQFQTLFDQSLTHFSRTDETDLKMKVLCEELPIKILTSLNIEMLPGPIIRSSAMMI